MYTLSHVVGKERTLRFPRFVEPTPFSPLFSLSSERARGPVSEHDVTRHASTLSWPEVFLDPSTTFLLYLTFSFCSLAKTTTTTKMTRTRTATRTNMNMNLPACSISLATFGSHVFVLPSHLLSFFLPFSLVYPPRITKNFLASIRVRTEERQSD